ncbi:PREDICTED: regulator of G-protein signaling 7-like [Priapulus caudatus]|uniref:Regulator of G-protein signaling 7-like n=1 Tax=Priapulus caudatus TaxID=37621 RepID=A0ABM1ELB3_PRICU|nr:PREDICTED: regulator of G-protein signaling 7-like [Priapulus caudatus]
MSFQFNYAVPGGRISPSILESDKECPVEALQKQIETLTAQLNRRSIKISKAADGYINYFEQYAEYDSFLCTADPLNPWISDTTEYWDCDKNVRDLPPKRVKRWAFSLAELMSDPSGRDLFAKFLDKEFSGENLREFLAGNAQNPVNIDSKAAMAVAKNMQHPDLYTFDEAAEHIYYLMKNDSYARYLRSEMYKELLCGAKKKGKDEQRTHFITRERKQADRTKGFLL